MQPSQQPDPASQPRIDEEPGITQEEAVPSDGKDTQGEKMMEELGRDKPGPKLANTPAEKE